VVPHLDEPSGDLKGALRHVLLGIHLGRATKLFGQLADRLVDRRLGFALLHGGLIVVIGDGAVDEGVARAVKDVVDLLIDELDARDEAVEARARVEM